MNDMVSLALAAAAFALSCLTAYFQFIRKSQVMRVNLHDLWFDHAESTFKINAAFAHSGNQEAVIAEARLILQQVAEGRRSHTLKSRSEPIRLTENGMCAVVLCFPCDERVVTWLTTPAAELEADHRSRGPSVRSGEVEGRLLIRAVDWKGRSHDSEAVGYRATFKEGIVCATTGYDHVLTLIPTNRKKVPLPGTWRHGLRHPIRWLRFRRRYGSLQWQTMVMSGVHVYSTTPVGVTPEDQAPNGLANGPHQGGGS